MGKKVLTNTIKKASYQIAKHSPEILTGIGVAGMLTTTVLAVRATPKAIDLIKQDSRYNHDGDPYAYTNMEAFKSAWRVYTPAAITAIFSMACIIGASSVNARRNAALATAYKISETALSEYRDAVVETIGEKKERDVKDKVAKKRIDGDPVSTKEVIITEKGNTLCYDSISGRYFKSDMDIINKAVNELNRRMLDEMYISLNEFYEEIGISHTAIGYELGWSMDGYRNGLIEISYSTQLAEDGTPCLVLDYDTVPKYDYSKLG